jgi:hypothetical protein
VVKKGPGVRLPSGEFQYPGLFFFRFNEKIKNIVLKVCEGKKKYCPAKDFNIPDKSLHKTKHCMI